jgi:hypothetical protein
MKIYLLATWLDDQEENIWMPLSLTGTDAEVKGQLDLHTRASIKSGGTSLKSVWQSLELRVVEGGPVRPMPDMAIVAFYGGLAFSQRAIDSLQTLLEDHGELLPLVCKEGDYQFFHVTTVVDALDLKNNLVRYSTNLPLPVGGKTSLGGIKQIEGNYSYAFLEGRLTNIPIFRLPMYYGSATNIFVSETFKTRVESCGLNSLEFLLVWDSEDPDYFDERYRNEPERWERYKRELAEQKQRVEGSQ